MAIGLPPALDAASIRGRLLDASNDIYLQGVEVRVLETGQSVNTERGGTFRITGIGEGEYTLEVRPMGFPAKRERVTIVYPDEEVYVLLEVGGDDVIEMAEFVVTAGILGQAKAMNIQRSADNLMNVISSDAFGEFVDRNAAEAMQRVVGVTVEDSQGEGKFIIIRGAAPGLSTVAIDGVQVATPEEDGRATGLNLIAIEQLESIELTKSWLPRQPANFIGGAVNLITRSALDREGQFMSLDVGYGKYEVSEEWSHKLSAVYGNVWGGEKVKFGMQVTYNQSMDRRGSDTVRIGDWHARVNVGLINALDGFRANTLYLEDYLIARERQGVSTKLELRVNNKHTFELSASLNRFDDDEVRQTYNYNAANGQQHYYGARYMTVTIARTLGYDPNDPAVWARITASNTDDRRLTFEEALKIDLGYDYDRKIFTKSIFDSDSQYRQWLSGLVKDEITTFQFGGTHNFTDNFSLNYKVHSSEASKETHQQLTRFAAGQGTEVSMELVGDRMVFYHRGGRTVFNPSVFGLGQGAGLIQDNMIYSDDERSGGELNAIYKWTTGRLSHQTEIGGYYDQREKSYWRNFNQYSDLIVSGRTVPRLYMSDPQFYGGVLEGFLEEYGMDYEFGPMVNTATARLFIDNPADYKVVFLKVRNDITSTVSDALLRDYSATEDIKSGYLMHSMDIGNLKLIGGVRFERTENTFTNNLILTRNPDLPGNLGRTFLHPGLWENMFKSIGPEAFTVPMTSERSYDHVLPALHAIYRVSDKLVVRAAVTQTLARPDYTDLVPREIPGISGAAYSTSITMPNFELMPLESVNYDLSADYYFKGFGYLYVGLFYKDLDGPIYTEHVAHDLGTETYAYLTNKYVSNPAQFAGTWSTRRRVNAGKGELYGLEFAYEQKFSRLPGPLSGLGMSMNFALMESSVHLPTTFTPIKDAKPLDRSGEKLPLFLQPDKLANLSVFWEKYGLLVRASLLYKGKYINDTAVSGSSVEELAAVGLPLNSYDVYVGDFLRLDLLVRYRLTRSLSIYFEGTNLNNEPIYHYYGEEWRMNMLRHTRPVYFVGMRWSY